MLLRFVHWLAWPVFRLLFGFRSRGAHHVPATGGVVIAANHASYWDPIVLACGLPHRPVSFMAKEELFAVPGFGWLIRRLGALPVRRGGVTPDALRRFSTVLRHEGRALVVFPEGTRTADGRLGPARRGVGAITRSAGVVLVPAYVAGTFASWPRTRTLPRWPARFEVRFGPPIQWADDELALTGDPSGALATLMMNAIADLERSPAHEPALRFWEGARMLLGPRALATPERKA